MVTSFHLNHVISQTVNLYSGRYADMDPRIQNLIGLNSDVGYAFGLTKSGKYMMTRNGGNLWTNISPKLYQSVSNVQLASLTQIFI